MKAIPVYDISKHVGLLPIDKICGIDMDWKDGFFGIGGHWVETIVCGAEECDMYYPVYPMTKKQIETGAYTHIVDLNRFNRGEIF